MKNSDNLGGGFFDSHCVTNENCYREICYIYVHFRQLHGTRLALEDAVVYVRCCGAVHVAGMIRVVGWWTWSGAWISATRWSLTVVVVETTGLAAAARRLVSSVLWALILSDGHWSENNSATGVWLITASTASARIGTHRHASAPILTTSTG